MTVESQKLASFPGLATLPADALASIAALATEERHAPDSLVFTEGDAPGDLYWLVHGQVQLTQHFDGRGTTAVLTLSDGELLGWSALLRRRRVASARTLSETTLVRFDTSALLELCEHDARVGHRVMALAFEELADRLHATRLQLLDVYGSR